MGAGHCRPGAFYLQQHDSEIHGGGVMRGEVGSGLRAKPRARFPGEASLRTGAQERSENTRKTINAGIW